ncbi:hypothetical protein D3C80_2076160 [compost metagenome]
MTAVWSFILKTSFEALSKTASDQNGTAPLARNRAGPSVIEKLQTAVRIKGSSLLRPVGPGVLVKEKKLSISRRPSTRV